MRTVFSSLLRIGWCARSDATGDRDHRTRRAIDPEVLRAPHEYLRCGASLPRALRTLPVRAHRRRAGGSTRLARFPRPDDRTSTVTIIPAGSPALRAGRRAG